MNNHAVLTIQSAYRPRIIERCLKALSDCNCNVIDSRVTIFGAELSIAAMVAGSWDAIAKLERALPALQEKFDFDFQLRRSAPPEQTEPEMPYAIEACAVDRVGVLHDIVDFLIGAGVSIRDLNTGTYAASRSGTTMCSFHATIGIPADTSIAAIRGDFNELCERLNLDAIMEPMK